MRLRSGLLAVAAIVAVGVANVGAHGRRGADRPPGNRLRAFDGCPAFLAYVEAARAAARRAVGDRRRRRSRSVSPCRPTPRATRLRARRRATEVEFSGTNVQEEGVDEPDLVEDERPHAVRRLGQRASARVDVRSSRPRLLGRRRARAARSAHELLLHGKRLLVLAQGAPRPIPVDGRLGIRAPWPYPGAGDAHRGRRRRSGRACGSSGRSSSRAATSRRGSSVGRRAIVLSSPMAIDLPFVTPVGGERGETARSDRAEPRGRRSAGARAVAPGLHACGAKRHGSRPRGGPRPVPERSAAAGFSGLGLVTVVTIDVERGLDPVDSDAVVSDGRVVYASPSSLYVATERWDKRLAAGRPVPERDVDGDPPLRHLEPDADALPVGSGDVAGRAPEPVVALRARRDPARREHRAAPVVGRAARPRARRPSRRSASAAARSSSSGASAGSARASASTPCASSATSGTSSRSARSTRSTRSTSRPVAARRPRRAEDPRLLGLPASRRRRPAARDRAGRDRRGPGARRPGVALRRLRPPPAETARRVVARQGLVGGRAATTTRSSGGRAPGSPCVPLQAYGECAVRRRAGAARAPGGRHHGGRPGRAPAAGRGRSAPRSAARSSSADALHRVRRRRQGLVARVVRRPRLRAPRVLGQTRSSRASAGSPGSSGGRSSRHVHCAGLLVRPEPEQLRAVAEPVSLHLVVAHLDDELGADSGLLELAAAPAVRLREAPLGRVARAAGGRAPRSRRGAPARRRPCRRSRARRRRRRGRGAASRSGARRRLATARRRRRSRRSSPA